MIARTMATAVTTKRSPRDAHLYELDTARYFHDSILTVTTVTSTAPLVNPDSRFLADRGILSRQRFQAAAGMLEPARLFFGARNALLG